MKNKKETELLYYKVGFNGLSILVIILICLLILK